MIAKAASLVGLAALIVATLITSKMLPRSGLGWRVEHFGAYFVVTLVACYAWGEAVLIGGAFSGAAVLLELAQAFTLDRSPNIEAAAFGVGGAVVAGLLMWVRG